MKIIYVASFSLTEKASGIGQYVVDVSKNMSKLGHVVAVFTYGDETVSYKIDDVSYLDIESFHYPPVRFANLSKSNLIKIDKFLNDFDPDIVHINLFSQIDFYVANWAKKRTIPIVYTTHLLPSALTSFGSFGKAVQKILNSRFVLKTLGKIYDVFDFMITPNKIAKKNIKDLGINTTTYIINNGFNKEILKRERSYHDKPKTKLLYVGGGHPRKNQLFLIKVMKHLGDDFQLNLIGRFYDEKYLKDIKKYISANNITNVNFLGLIKHDKVVEEMFKNDIFVSASKIEVQSLVVLEALATGLPTIALSNETTSELINEKNGMCLSTEISVDKFAKSVLRLSNLSEDQYKELSLGARDSVRSMTWINSVKSLEKVYKSELKSYKPVKSLLLSIASSLYVIMSRLLFVKSKSK